MIKRYLVYQRGVKILRQLSSGSVNKWGYVTQNGRKIYPLPKYLVNVTKAQ